VIDVQSKSSEVEGSKMASKGIKVSFGLLFYYPYTYVAREFTTEELLEATDNFSIERKIGGGGFGIVYRGYICGTTVAVKKLTEVSKYLVLA